MEMLRLTLSSKCQLNGSQIVLLIDQNDEEKLRLRLRLRHWKITAFTINHRLIHHQSEQSEANKYKRCLVDPDQARLEKLPAAPVSNESINCTDTA